MVCGFDEDRAVSDTLARIPNVRDRIAVLGDGCDVVSDYGIVESLIRK